jgi:hypothetical protein
MPDAFASVTTEDVIKIVSNGGGVLVSATRGAGDLSSIARNLGPGTRLRVCDSAALSVADMVNISRCSPGNVSFE